LFIDGEPSGASGGGLRELIQPATGEPLAKAAMAGEADVDRAVVAARAALEGPWGKTPPTERSRLLHALADAIQANRGELAELAAEVGFPPGVINIVPGDGPSAGAYLVKHAGVDKVAFTGSTKTGGEVMRLCSDPIKRVSLELGGKSPSVVFADADLDDAIP